MRADRPKDAETAPLTHPEYYQYDLDLAAVSRGVAARQRRGQLAARPDRRGVRRATRRSNGFEGQVSDSGEGRWTVHAAIDEGVPAPVLSAALYARFNSRGSGQTANKMLSAMRAQFGGHVEGTGSRRMSQTARNPPPTRWCCSAPPATSPSASCSRRCTTSSDTATSRCR